MLLPMANITGHLDGVFDKVLSVQRPTVLAYIQRVCRNNPDASPAEIIQKLDRQFLSAVVTMGVGAGAAAAVPGNPVGIAVNLLEVGTYLEASMLYVLALADVHGLPVHEVERRRTLLYGILLGDGGASVVTKASGRTGKHWARIVITKVDPQTLLKINRVLGKNFVTKYGTKEGILVLGREAPFGFGALIGAGGNALFGYLTIRAARRAFGPPPSDWLADPLGPEPESS